MDQEKQKQRFVQHPLERTANRGAQGTTARMSFVLTFHKGQGLRLNNDSQ